MPKSNKQIYTYISVHELSEYLGFSRSYIYKLVNEGKLPAYRPFNKSLFFKIQEVNDIIESNKLWNKKDCTIDANTASI